MAQKTFHFLFISAIIFLNYFLEYEQKLTFVSLILIIYILIFRNIFFNNEDIQLGNNHQTSSKYLIYFFLFISTFLFQNYYLNYETLTWDVASYLVASQEIGSGYIPYETQWESKGPLFLYLYFIVSEISGNNLVYFKILNDVLIYISSLLIFNIVYFKSKKNIFSSIFSALLFILVTSHEWFVSEFSEIYCLIFIGYATLIFIKKNNLTSLSHYYFIGFLISCSTLINQGSVVFLIPYLIKIFLDDNKRIKFLKLCLGFVIPHIFFISIYFLNSLGDVYLANYISIPLNYSGSVNNSSFYELSVVLRRFYQYENFLYFSILLIILFTIFNFLFKRSFVGLLDIIVLNSGVSLSLYFIANHNYAHHLFYLIFFICTFTIYLKSTQIKTLSLSIGIASIVLLFKVVPTSFNNLTTTSQLYENYPLKILSEQIDKEFDNEYEILALEYLLVLYYLDIPNVSYIIHPGNHYEEYIVEKLIELNKVQTNEFNHISYYIEEEPDVIMCNPTTVIWGVAEKTDFYNCGVDDYKKNYKKLDTEDILKNPIRNLYVNPYEAMNVYIKMSDN